MSPLQINCNVPPYHDDFDPLKNYYRVMYKPGYPVQARELTQSQSILQDQIEKLASRILKTGDQVNGGEYGFTNKQPYVRVSTITQGSKPSDFVGYTFTGQVTGAKAKVIYAYDQVTEGNNVTEDVTFHVQYEDQGVDSINKTFREGETITSNHPDNYTAVVGITDVSRPLDTPAMGFGSIFNITDGSYFIDGVVVRNDQDHLVVAKYDQRPTCQIGFLVSEDFVTVNEDPSLLDNSQGSSNFAAPGADRLQITLTLSKQDIDARVSNFVNLVDVVQGNVQGKPDQTVKWDWLYDILAQRTFDESGDYIVRDFTIKRLEYVNSANVTGLFDADPETGMYPAVPNSGSQEDLTLEEAQSIYVLEVGAGKAYVQGYEVGYTQPVYLYGNKPRTPQLSTNSFTHISAGATFTLSNISGSPDLQNITGDGNAVAFTPILMYKQFLDGHIGDKTETITYADGREVEVPINRNKRPLDTYHIVADGVVGPTQFVEIFNEENTCVVQSAVEIVRGDAIGAAKVLIAQKVNPVPTGFITPRCYDPSQVIDEQDGYEAFATTYNLGILSSTFFTELACVQDVNADVDWEVGSLIIGEISGATAVVEEGSEGNFLIVSNVVGEFENGEVVEQAQTNKSARLIRAGEVIGFEFYDKGDNNTITLDGETGIIVRSLGAETELTLDEGDIEVSESVIKLTQQGRDKLVKFPYAIDNTDRTTVKVNIAVETVPNGINGYALVVPAKITHTLQKTKSLFSGLNDVNNFAADISTQNASDTEFLNIADNSLFSGQSGFNFITCDNFSGDPSEELVAGDIVTFSSDNANVISKIVKFVTTPAGSGTYREKAYVYFTTSLNENVTGKVVQRMRIKTKGNVLQGLVYRMPEQFVKSLESNPIKTGINYQVARQFYQNVEAGSTNVTLSTNKSNEVFFTNGRTSVTIARNLSSESDPFGLLGRLVAIESFDIQDNGRKIVIYFTEPLATSATLKVVTSVYVTNAIAKRKIIRRNVKLVVNFPESAASVISLGKADIFKINQIKLVSTGRIITNNYQLDDGQRSSHYDIGRIALKPGLPKIRQSSVDNESGTIEIDFDYLEHENEGDFFSIDSYTHEDGINYTEVPYYDFEAQGASSPNRQNSSLSVPLRDCIDFRPIVNLGDLDPSVISSITPGVPSADAYNFRDSTNGGDGFAPRIPISNSQFQSDIEFYVGKIDTLFLDKTGRLVLQEGNQTEDPIRPADLATGLRLYDFRIQPFCINAQRNIGIKKFNYKRYRMKDIYGLDKRITRLEDVVTLSLLESKTLSMTIKDAVTGLDRFRTGYIVDPFIDHSRGDVSNPYYRCAIDPKRTLLRPPFFKDQVDLEEVHQTDESKVLNGNYVVRNGVATVPYENNTYSEQSAATRWINLQIYNTFTWNGRLFLNPSVDTFTDIRQKPDLNITDNSLFDAVEGLVDGLYELGVLGTVWESNHTLIDEYVDWNSEEHRDLLQRLDNISDQFTETDTSQVEILPPRRIGGGNAVEVTTQIFGTHITATGDLQVERELSITGGQTITTSYGDRITDMTLVTNMRTIPVFFTVTNVKPNTRFYAFFDDVDVNRWVSPDENTVDWPDGQRTCLVTPNGNPKGFGQPIVSDDRGVFTGLFLVPNGRPPLMQVEQTTVDEETGEETTETVNQVFDGYMNHIQYATSGPTRSFPTGQRILRFTTEKDNRDSTRPESDIVDSYAEAVFTASGIVADREKTVVSTRAVGDLEATRTELDRIVNEVVEVQDIQRTFRFFNIRRDDPVAQTFMVDENHPEGIFATELDVFFRTKDPVVGAEVYLIPTEGHIPKHEPIPMSRVTKPSDTLLRVQCTLARDSEIIPAGTIFVGQTSGATGVLKSAVNFQTATDNPNTNVTNHTYNVVFNNYNGDFEPGEQIIPQVLPLSDSTFFIVKDELTITRVDVKTFGQNYVDGETTVTFSQPELLGGVPATGIVKVSQGKVYAIEITNTGSGYINVPSCTIESGVGTEATALVRVKKGRESVIMGIATSEDGTVATKFKFDAPIYLLGNQTYAFVLYSASLEYTCFTSRLGENEIGTDIRVVEQPHLGSLFKSQNNGVWTEEQTEDIKHTLHKADFFTNTNSRVEMKNVPIDMHTINRDPIETSAAPGTADSDIFGDNPQIVTVYHDWHGMVAGDVVRIDNVVGDPGGIPNEVYNQLHTVIASDFRKFTIKLDTPATITEKAGGTGVLCSYNRPFESLTMKTGIIQAPDTSLTATTRTAQAETISGFNSDNAFVRDTPVQIAPEQRFYYKGPKTIGSSVNEIEYGDTFHLRGEPSLLVNATLNTSNVHVSPVIDIERSNVHLEKNLVDQPDKDDIIYGLTPVNVIFDGIINDNINTDDEITFTGKNGLDYTARIVDFNKNTGRVQLGGKHAHLVTSLSEFKGAFSGLPVSRITQQRAIDFVPETKNFGSTFAKWISRVFDLEEECDGVEMRMSAIFYDPIDIKVFYKPRAVGFDGDFSELSWIPFNPTQTKPGETEVDPNTGELVFTPGLCDNVSEINLRSKAIASPEILKNTDLYELKFSFQDAARFDAIAFKIVMTAENPARCPMIDDIRIVCSE